MKVTKTYSIEESIYNAFDSLTTEKNINKSSFIEEYIRKFLKDNDMDFIDKIYYLRTNPAHMVTVIAQDPTYYILSDGSKIQKILFMQIFTETETIDPKGFFDNSKAFEKIVEKVKNMDLTKVSDIKSGDYVKELSPIDIEIASMKARIAGSLDVENEQREFLNKVDKDYRSGVFITQSRGQICETLIQLMKINFNNKSSEELKNRLINILTDYKNSAPILW